MDIRNKRPHHELLSPLGQRAVGGSQICGRPRRQRFLLAAFSNRLLKTSTHSKRCTCGEGCTSQPPLSTGDAVRWRREWLGCESSKVFSHQSRAKLLLRCGAAGDNVARLCPQHGKVSGVTEIINSYSHSSGRLKTPKNVTRHSLQATLYIEHAWYWRRQVWCTTVLTLTVKPSLSDAGSLTRKLRA